MVTSAVSADHPEVAAAHAAGIPVLKRARALGDWVASGTVVAIAGTHGKTTTTAMTTDILAGAGRNPTGLVGGRVLGWESNLRFGSDDLFVVEADEYDRSFLTLTPDVTVITNVEADHLDIYGDVAGNHMNSRYASKWKDYRTRARWASDTVHRIGIGIAAAPLAKAPQPIVRTEPGATPVDTYHIRIAWRGANGANGAGSDVLIYTVDQDGLPAVRAEAAPDNAVGYDVYIGNEADSISRQNLALVAPGDEWTPPTTGLIAGEAPPDGQSPDWFVRNDRVFLRG